MNNQLKMRIFSIVSILSILLAAVGMPTGSVHAASVYTISGNAGAAGVTINANGSWPSEDGSAVSDSSGNYSVSVEASWLNNRWSGTVTPSKAGYSFSPSSRNYNNINGHQTNQNYTATQATYTISGSVGATGGGATITWSGETNGTTTASGSGSYSFTVPHGWDGTVTPTKTGYTFSPASRSYTNVTGNDSNENYTASPVTVSISGNAGVGNATITYTGGSTTANSSGNYSFTVTPGWSGTVTPSRTGFSFAPASRTYSNVTVAQSAQDYTARPTSFTFAGISDTHTEAAYFATTADQVASLNPALVLFTGDVETVGFASSEMNQIVNVLKNENLFNKTFMVRGNGDDHADNSATLWENYFETSPNIPNRPAYVANKVAINSSSDTLTYSFDYGNSIFIGIDVPGDIDYLEQPELDFINARLTYAEGAGLTHAFLFFHGPGYPIESVHSHCVTRTDATCTPPALMTIINNHPIVSALIHGQEHTAAWTHMDSTRVSVLNRSYEQFITAPGGGASYHEYLYPERVDYAYTDMENSMGFTTIQVNGLEFTARFYKVGTTQPVWTRTFSKVNTPPTISNIADQTTAEDTATAAIPFTVGDVETNTDYLTITASSSNTSVVPNENIAIGGSGVNRTLTITPALNQNGTSTITVSVNDGNVTVNDTFVLTVNPVNDAPVADPQSLSMPWDTSLNIVLTGNDVENSPITFDIVDEPEHGTLTGSGANRTYTPTAGYSGSDSFTFKVNDADLDSAPATVSILVTAHTISGNAGVAGATLSYMEGATPKTVTADGTGAYSFQVPAGWSGTVTPSKAGYNFSPASMSYTDVQANQTDQNYSVSGVRIVISGNAGVGGATLSYTDGTPRTITADENGLYSFDVPYNWSGMVTPSKAGNNFRPGTKTYTNVTVDQYAQDYIIHTRPTYYVDKTNPNCTDGAGAVGSFAMPYCTINKAANLATAGRVVHVLHGSYAESVYPVNSGTAANPISYWADPGVVVTGQPGTATQSFAGFALGNRSYIEIDGFHVDNTSYKGISVIDSHHITITNNRVSRAGESSQNHPYEQGIYLKNTTDSIISYNTTDHNTCIGIRLTNGSNRNLVSYNTSHSNFSFVETDAAGIETTGASYNTIINNLTYSNEDSGINIYVNGSGTQSTYNLVINNLTYENGDHGIDVNNSPYNTIVDNTVHGNGTVGINVEGNEGTGSHHTIIANNISTGNGFTPPAGSFGGNLRVDTPSVPGTTSDYNIVYRESAVYQMIWDNLSYVSLAAFKAAVPTQEVHSIEADPLFVDPVESVRRETGIPYEGLGVFGNYYTQAGSPAIDSANSDAPQHQPADIDGNTRLDDPGTPNSGAGVRTYDDRGAYEYLPAGPSLPVITTQAVTGITSTTATGNGNLTATGLPNPTEHGVVWSTSPNPTTDDSKTTDGPMGATGAFTSNLTGLIPGTLYYVRAYATNTVGTAYGGEVTFTTHLLPTVLTQAVTNVTTTTATGNGNITGLGVPNPTQHGMVWSTSPNPTTADNKTEKGPATAIGAFTSNLTGLTPGTLYYVRAYVTNAAGTVYGNDFTFTTHIAPTVTTQAVTDIATTTATGNGNIVSLGVPNPTQHGFVWSTSPNPTTANNKTTNGPVTATGAFTSNITGLTPGTLYYVRAYATNDIGTVYGAEVTFTALQVPTVTTQAATNITGTTATGNGNIISLGVPNPTEHGVVWSTVANPTIADNKTTNGAVSAAGTFISSITGLTPGTLYHVRAYATNAAGTSYGNDVTFTTDILPTVTTQAVTSITQTTATGNGNVTALGVPNPSEHGVVWSTLPNPTTADSKTTDGPVNATGAFTSSILGLTPGTLYYVRAYATNEVGTIYGEEVTFTTLLLPTVTTQAATDITITTATGNGNVMALGLPNPTQHGFVWSTSPNPTIADSKTTNGPVSATGAFTGAITGLSEGMLYHIRAYATNAAGTVYGEDVTFTTLLRPGVTTQAATDITQTTATGNGNITLLGSSNPTEHGLVWSTSANPTTADNKTTNGPVSATGAFTGSITGLTPGTLYHVRAYAINAAGTSYGEDVTFTTLLLPTVTTQAVTDITETTATGNGNVNVLGIPNPTQHGVVWSTSPNPTTADSKTTDGAVSVTGAFTSSMTGLTIGTQYYVRAYATNAAGTVYGNEVTFTTVSTSTGTTTPVTNAGSGANVAGSGTAVWLNPGYVTANDTNYAQVNVNGTTSQYLQGTNYGFTIPANAIINGIQVTIGRYESGQAGGVDVRDAELKLLKNGLTTGSSKAALSTEWPTAEANAIYGSNNDLWGASWTAADINASNFGVSLSVHSGVNRTAYVDTMQIAVTYTVTQVGSITSVNCGAGTPVAVYGSSITCVATITRGSGTFTPTGNVNWTTNGGGSFNTNSCSIAGANGVATCSVTYTPSAVGSGSHLITADYAGDLSFYASTGNQTVTVNPKPITITPIAGQTKVFGDSDPLPFSYTRTALVGADAMTGTLGRVSGENVGTYAYTLGSLDAGPNYILSMDPVPATFNIAPKLITITPDAGQTKAFGDSDPLTFTYSHTTLVGTDAISGALSRVSGEDVGAYEYTLGSLNAGTNYTLSIVSSPATFSITTRSITITPDAGQTKVFGDADPTLTYTHTLLVGMDALSGALGRVSGEDAGTYAYTLGSLTAGTNYTLNLVAEPATFSITTKPITVTADAGQSKVFGTDDPIFTYTSSDANASFTGALDRMPGSDVGSYAIGQGTLAVVGGNYSMSFVSNDFSITPRPITITPDAGQTKVFGDSDPLPFSYTHTALVGSDTIGGTLGRVAGEDAGIYAYTLGSLGAGTNYTLIMASSPETFSITARPITVTADAGQSKVLGAADPVFTYTSSDPGASFTGALDRAAGEDVGTYAIGQGTLALVGNNYNMTFISNDFTITPPTDDYTLTLIPGEHGTITAVPSNTVYHWGDVVELTATAHYGWAFANWTGDLSNVDNPASITIRGNATVTANYTAVAVAPLFTSTPVTGVAEDTEYTYNITTSDPNTGDILAISAETKPAWLGFTDNGDGTARLSGTPTNTEVGSYDVLLRVSDGTLTTDQSFSILVTNTNDAPSFTSTPVTDADEDSPYTYNITVTDPDTGADLTITAQAKPDWLTLTDNGDGTAALTGTPSNADVGIHNVTLRVNDGTMDVDQIFTIDVGNVNDGPAFTSTPVTSVNEDIPYTYEITATDPDTDDLLTISASTTLPAWLTLTDHGDRTATLTGTPANGNVGNLDVTLQVSDSLELASQPFTITVVNVNDAPALTQPLDQTNEQGDVVSLQLSATDVDAGDVLTYSASGLPEELSIDTETGLITGEITGEVNTYTVTVGVDDGHGGTDSKTFTWNVTPPTYTLTVTIIGNGTVTKDPDQTSYLNGTEVSVTATPAAGWRLDHWSENVLNGKVTISGDTTVTVTFVQEEYTLTINTVGSGSVTQEPNQPTYHYGDVVTLTATPEVGWVFGHWSENVVGGQVMIQGITTVTATFEEFVPVPVLVLPSGTLDGWDYMFAWTGLADAEYYRLEVYDAADTMIMGRWFTNGICTGLSCSYSPVETKTLSAGDFKWRVQSYGPTGFSPWTEFMNFSLNAVTLRLVSPAGSLDNWTNSFRWSGISSAEYYHMELREATSDALVQDLWYPLSVCTGLSCAASPVETLNLANGEYKWRLQTYSSAGYTPWSEYVTFDLTAPVLVLNAPSGTLASWEWDKTFRWAGIPSAEYYHTQVYDALTDTLLQEEWYNLSICNGLECAVSPSETRLLGNGQYKWRVQSYGTLGYTPWTAFTTFTISSPTVVLNTPSGTLTSWDKTFHWTGIASAEYYHTQVYDALSDTLLQDEWYGLGICTGLTCSISPSETRLLPNGQYKWRVQSYGTEGYTAWSEYVTFTLNYPTIVLNAPLGNLTSWDNHFEWTGIPSAEYYHLQVYNASTDTLVQEEWYTLSICTGLNCAVSPVETLNLPNGDYKWRVQSFGTEGYTSWTDFATFTLNQ